MAQTQIDTPNGGSQPSQWNPDGPGALNPIPPYPKASK